MLITIAHAVFADYLTKKEGNDDDVEPRPYRHDIDWRMRLRIGIDIVLGMMYLHELSPPMLHR